MHPIEHAWSAFNSVIEEVHELHARGGSNLEIADSLKHADELLRIIEEEAQLQAIEMPPGARYALLQMRVRIQEARVNFTVNH